MNWRGRLRYDENDDNPNRTYFEKCIALSLALERKGKKIPPLVLGCTIGRHYQIGIHAAVNARAGLQYLNDYSMQDAELWLDYRDYMSVKHSGPWNWRSKWFRKHFPERAYFRVFEGEF